MKCAFPVEIGPHRDQVSCGKCMPCRINHMRRWLGRLLLESLCHQFTWFMTLTYDDDHLPVRKGPDGSAIRDLCKEDLQKWIKRCRKAGIRFRYFAVGEYGEKTERPHYHAIVFGPPLEEAERMQELWGLGFTSGAPADIRSMRYTLGYVLKKMTRVDEDDPRQRPPEFALYSRRPPIGWPGMKFLIEPYKTSQGRLVLDINGDIQRLFRSDGSNLPLEYRMAQYIRGLLGIPTSAADRPKFNYDDLKGLSNLRDMQDLHDKLRRQRHRGRTL